jgi:maltose O-acetyltransferase
MLERATEPEPGGSVQPRRLHGRSAALHPRLLAVNAFFGWVPNFVASRGRTAALRAAGIEIGKSTVFFGLPTLLGSGDVTSRLRIGQYCGFNKGSLFDLEAPVTLGDHVAVGHDVMFLTRTHSVGPAVQRAGDVVCAPITIGDGVWLGARSVVMPGVTIGAGSVIGAGIVVSQDIAENTLFVGTQKVSIARWR